MSLVDHIVTAVDFSNTSLVALQAAARLVERVGCKRFTVLHAVDPVVFPAGEDVPEAVKTRLTGLRTRVRAGAEAKMAGLFDKLGVALPGVEVQREIVEGRPAQCIPERAEALGASLLVVGTHAREGLRRWISGSVSEGILSHTRLPLLVMHIGDDHVTPEQEMRQLDHILAGVDADANAVRVVDAAAQAARAFKRQNPELTLLTVASLPVVDEDDAELSEDRRVLSEHIQGRLDALIAKYPDVNMNRAIVPGDAEEQLLAEAKRRGSELIVIGSHGHGGAPLFELGSTSREVIRHSDVSVLVVPSHADHPA